jgi:hypothetical protein
LLVGEDATLFFSASAALSATALSNAALSDAALSATALSAAAFFASDAALSAAGSPYAPSAPAAAPKAAMTDSQMERIINQQSAASTPTPAATPDFSFSTSAKADEPASFCKGTVYLSIAIIVLYC